jgi:hypothetical protein
VVVLPQPNEEQVEPMPSGVDAELLRRREIRHKILQQRKQTLALECKLSSLLRIAGDKLSKTEQDEVHRLCAELEASQAEGADAAAAAAAAGINRSLLSTHASELGTWKLLHAPSKGSMLTKVLRRDSDNKELQRVTYISQYLRIARSSDGALYIFQRVTGPAPETACADCVAPQEGKNWFWPL